MDIGNMILALQDQLLQLEEKVVELTKLRETDIEIHREQVNGLHRRINELEMTKSMPMPAMPSYPAYPAIPGTGTPVGPWAGTTITSGTSGDVDKMFVVNAAEGLMYLEAATDPFFGLKECH